MTDAGGPVPRRVLVVPFVALACFLMVHGRNEQRLRAIYRIALAATLARFVVDLVADPSWGNLLVVAGLGAVTYLESRSHRRERERAVAA